MENEQVQEALKLLIDAMKDGKDFAVEQAPLLVQEVIRWGIASYSFLSVLFVVLSWACAWTARWAYRRGVASDDETDRNMLAAVSVVAGALAAAWLVPAAVHLYGLAYVLAAPRLYVIEQLTRVVR